MTRMIVALAIVGIAAAGCAPGATVMTGDPDRQITEAEFMEMAPNIAAFGHWDTDRTGYLTPEQFDAGMQAMGLTAPHGFDAWDAAGDGRLTEEEYYRGLWATLDPEGRGYITERDLVRHQRPLRR